MTEPEKSRQEGDWLIIPVMEEVFVVEKHLMVTEEIRIRKRLVVEDTEVRDTVRRERAAVEDARVPREALITQAVMPGSPSGRTRGAAAAGSDASPRGLGADDAAWDELHREVRDAGR